jgi:2-polyprenyl-6-methoxyphenol hydroxylase-like FAD-dependent oxidoreductase
MGTQQKRVLIVGGGIAGLTMAAAMKQFSEWDVELIERSPEWSPQGAGIVVSCNATVLLHQLGMAESLKRYGHPVSEMVISDKGGRSLSSLEMGPLVRKYGPAYAIHRAELHQSLLEACDGVKVTPGESVQTLKQSAEGVDVTFASGREGHFTLVVGADGLNSSIRSMLSVQSPQKVYSGHTCWRFVGKNPTKLRHVVEMWGRGKRVGLVPLANERVYVFLVANAPENTTSPAELLPMFSEFGGFAPEILAQLPEVELLHHDLHDLETPLWFDGHVALLGDAAHGMTPNMGQGAAQAIESAWVLAAELRNTEDVGQALRNYKRIRESRVKMIMSRSRQIGRIGQLENSFVRWLRDLAARMTPSSVMIRNMENLLGEGSKLLQISDSTTS